MQSNINLELLENKCNILQSKIKLIKKNNEILDNEQLYRIYYLQKDFDNIIESINELELSFYKNNKNLSNNIIEKINNEKIVENIVDTFSPFILAYSNYIQS